MAEKDMWGNEVPPERETYDERVSREQRNAKHQGDMQWTPPHKSQQGRNESKGKPGQAWTVAGCLGLAVFVCFVICAGWLGTTVYQIRQDSALRTEEITVIADLDPLLTQQHLTLEYPAQATLYQTINLDSTTPHAILKIRCVPKQTMRIQGGATRKSDGKVIASDSTIEIAAKNGTTYRLINSKIPEAIYVGSYLKDVHYEVTLRPE
jgi:hypothetical protein